MFARSMAPAKARWPARLSSQREGLRFSGFRDDAHTGQGLWGDDYRAWTRKCKLQLACDIRVPRNPVNSGIVGDRPPDKNLTDLSQTYWSSPSVSVLAKPKQTSEIVGMSLNVAHADCVMGLVLGILMTTVGACMIRTGFWGVFVV